MNTPRDWESGLRRINRLEGVEKNAADDPRLNTLMTQLPSA